MTSQGYLLLDMVFVKHNYKCYTLAMNKNQKIKLAKIIEKEGGINWWQPKLFEEKIKKLLPKELQILENPPKYKGNYNCFVYGLGLQNDKYFLGGKNPVQQEFIKYLLDKNILIKKNNNEEKAKGDLIFYVNKKWGITHVSILDNESVVISKWMWGPIIKHKIWDIPSSFGSKIFYCKKVNSEKIKKEYLKYKKSGVFIKPIS